MSVSKLCLAAFCVCFLEKRNGDWRICTRLRSPDRTRAWFAPDLMSHRTQFHTCDTYVSMYVHICIAYVHIYIFFVKETCPSHACTGRQVYTCVFVCVFGSVLVENSLDYIGAKSRASAVIYNICIYLYTHTNLLVQLYICTTFIYNV